MIRSKRERMENHMMVTKIAALLAEAEGQINNDLPTVDQVAEYLVEHGVILKEDGCCEKD